MKGEGNRVEVERLPHLSELAHEGQAVEIASVQDPETGATRYSYQYCRTGDRLGPWESSLLLLLLKIWKFLPDLDV